MFNNTENYFVCVGYQAAYKMFCMLHVVRSTGASYDGMLYEEGEYKA